MEILIPVLTLGVLGLIFGAGLALAAKKFCVTIDPRLEKIFTRLPGVNCGACGKPGCMGFAEGLIKGDCTIERCPVSEDETRREVSRLLGREFKEKTKSVAVLHCNGGTKVGDRFVYQGIEDCVAANLALGGQKACVWGCLGLDSCVKVCPFGAITMSGEGLPVVNKNKCTACNKCVQICPKKLFSLVEVKHKVYIACSSHDLGKDTKAECSVGCIACKLCEKACKFDAIHVIDNLAVIDYSKCTSCGACVKVCPMKTIQMSA